MNDTAMENDTPRKETSSLESAGSQLNYSANSDLPVLHNNTLPSAPSALVEANAESFNGRNLHKYMEETEDDLSPGPFWPSIYRPSWHVHFPTIESQPEDDDPNARYEDIGIDRKYFDHDYYLEYISRVPPPSDEEEEKGETTAEQPDGSEPAKKKTSFHIDEDTWLFIFYSKIKLVLESGKDIQMPSEPNMHRFYNNHFEGKILMDSNGEPLPPRPKRINSTMWSHLWHCKMSDDNMLTNAMKVHEEMIETLDGKTGGQLYIPVVTDEDIQKYRDTGVIDQDDPDDAEANLGLAFTEKELRQNHNRWNLFYEKRHAAREAGSDWPKPAPYQENNVGIEDALPAGPAGPVGESAGEPAGEPAGGSASESAGDASNDLLAILLKTTCI